MLTISAKARNVYEESIVVDGQLGFEEAMPWSFEKKWQLVDRYMAAGFSAITLSLANDETTTEQALLYLAKIREYMFRHPDKYILARNAKDILQAKRENKIALRLMFQGTSPIGKNLELVGVFKELGISSMAIAYNIRTPMGDGIVEEHDAGLSHLGKKFVNEMNRRNMIIDGAHGGYQTTMDVLNVTSRPFVFSHTNVYSINPHIRNIKDEQIITTAKTGGLIGISGLGILMGDEKASLEKYVDHMDYVCKLVGTEHVALGLDTLYFSDQFAEFMQSQSITHPQNYAKKVAQAVSWRCVQPEEVVTVVELLLQRGYKEQEIKSILGNNILRLLA